MRSLWGAGVVLTANHEATVGSGLGMGAHLARTPAPSLDGTVGSAPNEAGAPEGSSRGCHRLCL